MSFRCCLVTAFSSSRRCHKSEGRGAVCIYIGFGVLGSGVFVNIRSSLWVLVNDLTHKVKGYKPQWQ